jgi:hypothetical protein
VHTVTTYHSGSCQMFEHDGDSDVRRKIKERVPTPPPDWEHEVEDDGSVDSEGHGIEDSDGHGAGDLDGHGAGDSDGHSNKDSDGYSNEGCCCTVM